MKKQFVIIGIVALFVCIGLLSGCTSGSDEFGWDKFTVQYEAERQIKELLKSPSTAQFSEQQVQLVMKYSSYNEYKVTGKVDAQNSFGAMLRNSFYIYLECYSNGKYVIGEWNIY